VKYTPQDLDRMRRAIRSKIDDLNVGRSYFEADREAQTERELLTALMLEHRPEELEARAAEVELQARLRSHGRSASLAATRAGTSVS
jgi:hypothetical protein